MSTFKLKYGPAAVLLALSLASCTEQVQVDSMTDPNYQPSSRPGQASPAIPASVALAGVVSWDSLYIIRGRQIGSGPMVQRPWVIWGTALQQDLLAELQGNFRTAYAVPFGGNDNNADVFAIARVSMPMAQTDRASNALEALAARPRGDYAARLSVQISLVSRHTGKTIRTYQQSTIFNWQIGDRDAMESLLRTNIENVTSALGSDMAHDAQLRSDVANAD